VVAPIVATLAAASMRYRSVALHEAEDAKARAEALLGCGSPS